MEDIVGLSSKERARLVELELVKGKRQTLSEAADRVGVSRRQVRRSWVRFEKGGARALAHASRGLGSNRALGAETRLEALKIYEERLSGFGPTLAAEKLAEQGVEVDHETLRRWLVKEGLWRKRRKRGPHRKWRQPKEHFGELVQMDGSFHDWFEDGSQMGSQPCLIDLVDDATGAMTGEFRAQETTEGAMSALWGWIKQYGVPKALYTDHKSVYVTDREPTTEEQLIGQPALTEFGKACFKLGIEIIAAASPQAKGRIERRHGVLQDRLVKEMRLEGIQDLAGANALLSGGFLAYINRKFAHAAVSTVDFHRPVPSGLCLEDVFAFEERRLVQNDWTVSWDGRFFQITGPRSHMPRRREHILVRRRLDGSRFLIRRGHSLEFHELPERPSRPTPKTRPTPVSSQRTPWLPPRDHPWLKAAARDERLRIAKKEALARQAANGVDS